MTAGRPPGVHVTAVPYLSGMGSPHGGNGHPFLWFLLGAMVAKGVDDRRPRQGVPTGPQRPFMERHPVIALCALIFAVVFLLEVLVDAYRANGVLGLALFAGIGYLFMKRRPHH